ncbi:MAG: C39 family peptidase [Ezakiella sp.]|nr:C39 family peptidase [Ezakiella sp.]
MNNDFKKIILFLLLAMLTFTACKKKIDEKPVENKEITTEVKTDEKSGEDKKSDEENSKEEKELNSITLKTAGVSYDLIDVDGEKYVELIDFSNFLDSSKGRFAYQANDKNKRIQLRVGEYNYEEPTGEFDITKATFDEFELKNKDNKLKTKIAMDGGRYAVKLDDIAKAIGFSIEDGAIVYDEPDTKQAEVSNNRDYDWYMDQAETGEYSDGNCGPTSMAMALKWRDPNSTATGESCRNEVLNDGKWWTTNIVESYLDSNNIAYNTQFYKNAETITNEIDDGNIVFVCITMEEIKENKEPDSSKIGRFYEFGGGHFLLIKGYKIIDGELYYEVYDPNSWGSVYSETGEPMGKDRLYKASEMEKAIKNWWMTVYGIKPLGK